MDSIGRTRFGDIRGWKNDGLHEFWDAPLAAVRANRRGWLTPAP